MTVMSKHRSCPFVPAKGMSRSAGHRFLTNVKLQGLEDKWFRGFTKTTCKLFFSVFKRPFLYNGFSSINREGGGKTLIDECQ